VIEGLGKLLSLGSGKSWRRSVSFSDAEHEMLFRSRLLEAVCWCQRMGQITAPKSTLRSPLLQPEVITGEGASASWDHRYLDISGAVARLCKKRANLLGEEQLEELDVNGRLLLFWPEETLDCGAAQESSKGYFDAGNTPPWDTWLWFGPIAKEPSALISWVPQDFLSLVEQGLWANPEQCIQWL